MDHEPLEQQRSTSHAPSPDVDPLAGAGVEMPTRSADVGKLLQPRTLQGHEKDQPLDFKKVPGHPSSEIHLHIAGHGSVTGDLVATIENGQPGVPLTEGELKALKATVSVDVGHLIPKVEHAVLNDELTLDTPWNGLTFRIEASALNVAMHGPIPDLDLATISLKVTGDLTHLMSKAPRKGITLTLDGRLSVAIAGHLAGRLAAFAAAQRAEVKNLETIEQAGRALETEKDALQALEEERPFLKAGMTTGDSAAKLAEVDAKIAAKKALIKTTVAEVSAHTAEQEALRLASKKAASKLTGKLVGPLVRVLETKVAQQVGKVLLHLIPIVDVLMLIWDVIDIVQLLSELADLHDAYPEDGSDHSHGDKKPVAAPPRPPAPSTTGKAPSERMTELLATMRPTPRAIVDALSHGSSGPKFDEEALRALDALVPDLDQAELEEVIAELANDASKAKNDEELVETVTSAVRRVRDRSMTMSADGDDVTSALQGESNGAAGNSGDNRSPAQEAKKPAPGLTKVQQPPSGPITQPSLEPTTDRDIVHGFDANLAATWFELRDGQVQLTSAGSAWVAGHGDADLGKDELLRSTTFHVTSTGPGHWNLAVTFAIKMGKDDRNIKHSFFVATAERGGYHGFGAANHSLSFEAYDVYG